MDKFSTGTKYGDIIHDPLFKGHEYMLDFRRFGFSEEFERQTLLDIEKSFHWNSELLAESANYIYECQKKKNVFFDFNDGERPMTGLAAFVLEKKSKFVLICPGGGFSAICAILEGYNLAKKLNRLGYAAFVLSYSVADNAAVPNPQNDIANAVKFIISNSDEFNIDIDDYMVIGFSAGAYVAGCFGTEQLGYMKYSLPKPKMIVLGYPVLTMGKYTHEESKEWLLGKTPDAEMADRYSVEKNVTENYPATFLWQCNGDPAVPFENSQLMAAALEKNGVPFVYEAMPYNAHGLPTYASENDKNWLLRALDFYGKL